MSSSTTVSSHAHRRASKLQRRMTWTGLLTILSLIVSLFPQVVGSPMPTASAHNLNASVVYVYFDANTQAYLDGLIATNQRPAGTPLLQPGDELGIIIKAVPDEGTTTGVGGYSTFYIPNGVQVVDAAYIMPGDLIADGITGFDKVPMKGQAQMPIVGAGGDPTVSLVGITRGPNILGVTSPIVTAGNTNLGTVVGVYGDTGIFYSTAPETAFGTYTGGSITNNSGDTVGLRTVLGTTLNKWDAWQMAGYGIKGTTNPAYPAAALIDSNQRGYAPWGLANVVAGPQSGYAWEFDFAKYTACDPSPTATPTSACIDQATQDIGPWQRIKYPGSQFSDDPPGGTPSLPQPYTRGADASNSGFDLTAGDLPQTTGQANGTPVAVRWAYGQQTQNRPEYMWIKIKVHDNTAILDPTGCPKWTVDTFGGDAGGDSGGKDHIWRYYDPNSVTFNGCLAVGKPATRELVKVGDNYQYKIKLYNAGNNDFSTVQIQDTLPSGVTYISAVPAPSSVSLPNLTWTVAPFLRSQMFEATVTVQAKSSGLISNSVCTTGTTTPGGQTINSCGKDVTVSGPQPLLRQSKSVTPSSVAPGGSVAYTINVLNVGSGPTGSPVVITEYLPAGFTYNGGLSTTVNGASVTASVSGPTSQPVFSVPSVINAGGSLVLKFNALVSASITAGNYCNSYRVSEGGINQVTGALACVDVGGGTIGDTVYRDWNGNGVKDAEDEGLPGVTVMLNTGACPGGAPTQTATTDASGFYQFTGLPANTYCVDPAGPAGYTLTQGTDPTQVTLTQGEKRLDVDFGYKPGGAGSIGDKVFEDKNNDGVFNGTDVGIDGVTLTLYEDSDNDGVVDAGQDAQVGLPATTAGGGNYGFTNLDPTRSYIVVATDGAGSAVDTYFANPYISSTGGSKQTVKPADFTAQGNAVTDADFGYLGQTPRAIGDQVFIDTNGNATYEAGTDTPLPGITVDLYRDANGDGIADPGELSATTSSAADGSYLFGGLGPDDYIVIVDTADPQLPAGYFAVVDHYDTTLTSASDVLTDDFPFTPLISKSVSATSITPPGNLTFNITINYSGDQLLSDVRVVDSLPKGVTFTSATAGGTDGAYVPRVKEDGVDDGPPATTTSLTASPTTVAQGGSVTISMLLTNDDAASITGVTAGALTVNNGSATCGAASPSTPQNVGGGGGTATFTYTCVVNSLGELTFTGDASGTWSSAPYDFAAGTSNSVLVSLEGMPNAVIWNLGSNTAGQNGVTYITGTGPGIYAFRGDDKTDFWRYEVLGNTWATKDVALGTVKEGGALAYDGGGYAAGYIYGFRGDGTNKFWRYDIDANNWEDTPADAPQNVKMGGALVYLNGYVYAFRGDDKTDFWRYDPVANSWLARANAPENVKEGGALTTNGAYIYAFRGAGSKKFWRYDPVANTWLARKDAPQNVKWGGALTRIGNYIYATRGDDKRDFWRYDITANTWSILAAAPGTFKEGGALTTDGTVVYALRGDGAKGFWRYNPSNNQWTTLLAALQNVKAGGALAYVPGTAAADYITAIRATPTLVSNGKQIEVTMLVSAESAVNNVTPSALTVTPVNGAGVSPANCGSPTPPNQNLAAGVLGSFTWTCTVSAGANPGSLTFSGSATGIGPVTFPAATSNSILVTPVLSYTGAVSASPGVSVVRNNAIFSAGGGGFDSVPSNTTETAVTASIGDRVWSDVDGDGVQDAGEPGLAGVEVCATPTGGGAAMCDTTDVNGAYRIYGLTNGATYNAALTPGTIPTGYAPTFTPTQPRTATTAGESNTDFGLRPPGTASIGDYVWLDADNDGVQDPNENGLPNVTVRLYIDQNNNGAIDGGDTLIQTTTTDSFGAYLFSGLHPDDYLVDVDQTSSVTSPYDGATTIAAAMAPTTGTTDPRDVTITTVGQAITNADFGYNWTGSIGDTVWFDTNQNQAVDGGETLIVGATVLLYYDADNNGVIQGSEWAPIRFMNTIAGGQYLFDNLPPGNYLVDVYEDSITSDGVRDIVPTTPDVRDVDLTAGQDVLTADFGYVEGAKVEGNVFWDEDHNGVLDPAEANATHLLENVTVTIVCYGADGVPGGTDDKTLSMDTGTGGQPDGHFKFLVPPGPCTLSYETSDTNAKGYPEATTLTPVTFTAQAGEDWHPSFDFGVDNAGKIGDRVWNDANGDGIQTAGEPGISGVTVRLYAADGTTLLNTQATDTSGNYQFVGLANATYVVKVDTATLPSGYTQTGYGDPGAPCGGSCNNQGTTTVSGGNTVTNVDFGYKPPANTYPVNGRVWKDLDGNGAQNGAEPGIAGVTVCLYDSTGTNVVACTTTQVTTGDYTFPGTPNGTYVIKVDPTTLPAGGFIQTGDPNGTCPGAACDNKSQVTVNNAPVTNQNFGYQQPLSSISGTVCYGNGNGDCTTGEPVAVGVPVYLTYAGPDGIFGTPDDVTTPTVTDGSGNYTFPNLPGGAYQVTKLDPPGATSLADADGGNPNNISIILTPGQNEPNQDFEMLPAPGAIGDRVWLDENGNGLQDAGEDGIPNAKAQLYAANGTTLLATTYTDANGGYLFPALQAGTYVVKVDPASLPAGLAANPTYDEDGVGTANQATVTLASGEEHLTTDFGYNWAPTSDVTGNTATGAIGDRVWADTNGNGVQDPGEAGLGNVSVELVTAGPDGRFGTGDDVVAAAMTTNAAGNYIFDGLAAGGYVVRIPTPPAGYTQTGDPDGTLDNQTTQPIVLAPGDVFVEADFGYAPQDGLPNSLGDTVWLDVDRDGVQDAGEASIPGVTVQLTWAGPDGNLATPADNVVYTTVTDDNGNYLFSDLPDGNFQVTTNLPSNTGAGGPLEGLLAAYDGSGSPTDGTSDVALDPTHTTSGPVTNLAQDFGYSPNDGTGNEGLIGDTIFFDANGNGRADPGEGIPGVKVTLDGSTVTYTDANGNYYFGGLAAGSHTVVVDPATLPGGLTNSVDPDGGNNNTATLTLATNSSVNLNQDFGYTGAVDPLPNSLGDRVWLDVDRDGVQDPGEAGIGGVLVQLTWAGPDGNLATPADNVVYTTVTDVNGGYLFTDLPDGNFRVTTNLPSNTGPGGPLEGLFAAYDASGSPTDGTSDVALDPTHTASGPVTNLAQDFGYSPNDGAGNEGLIGDTIFFDANGNDVADPGEGLPGVKVTLDGSTVTYTDANGNYYFGGLAAGGHTVVVDAATLPAGLANTFDPDGGNDNQATVTLAANEVRLDQDFGFQATALLLSAIGDTVWVDANRDNTRNAGEPGIPGVSVALIRDTNGNGVWDAGEPIIATDITDANGNYQFGGLPTANGVGTDDYLVWVNDTANVLAPLVATYDVRDGANQGNPTAGVVTGLTISAVTHLDATPVTNADFAFAPVGQDAGEGLIGDTIYLDRNGNQTPDAGEGLEGVKVQLYAANGTTLLETTTTNENGQYFFGSLNPTATYVVKVDTGTLPGGLTNTVDPDGGTANQATVNLATSGPTNLNQDFGYDGANTIAGTLWQDTDADGLLDGGESGGWAGVTVVLLDANNNVVGTTTTDANGNYSFGNLPDGTFKVDVTDDGNVLNGAWKSTGPTPGADNNSQADPYPVTVSGGQTNSTADFGYYNAPAGLGNYVWRDLNANGIQDVGEPGLAGVEVTLTITWPSAGGSSTVKTTTDASGYYSFGNLLLDENMDGAGAGEPTFTIAVATPAGYVPTLSNQGSNDALDSDLSGVTATTTEGTVNTSYDFGFVNQVPDVTPVITAVPNVMTGITRFNIFVQVTELLVVPTNGLITVRVPKDTRWVFDGPYDSTLTVLGGTPLNNPVWAYSQNTTQHIFTTTATIPAGGFSTFGFKALWNAGQTQGLYTITSQIDSFSGGENRINNNSDAEKLDYFIN